MNLIVGARSKKSKKGDVVVVGADRPDGSVVQDKGRLNVVQARAKVPAPAVTSSEALVNAELPLTEAKKEKRRVVYSVPIPAPRKGEVLAFDAALHREHHRPALQHLRRLAGDHRHRADRDRVGGAREAGDPAARAGDRVERLQLHPRLERLRQSRARR